MKTLLWLILPALLVTFCPALPAPEAAPPSRIEVSVDPRLELYAVVLTLSGFQGPGPQAPALNAFELEYRQQIAERFAPWRDHEAVRRYREMAPRGFWLGHPPNVMVTLGPPPELEELYPVDPLRLRMAGGRDSLELFLSALRDFSRESAFMEFFAEQQPGFDRMVARFRASLDDSLLVALEDYYGGRQHSYRVILAPLFMSGGYGPRVEVTPGRFDSYYIGGPLAVQQGAPVFENSPSLFQHEFSHSFVNHLATRHADRLDHPWTVLQGASREELERYGDFWKINVADQVGEQVVRAVTSRLAALREGPAAGEAEVQSEVRQGFPYVPEVYALLQAKYEADRGRYPDLESFFPEIVTLFERLAAEKR